MLSLIRWGKEAVDWQSLDTEELNWRVDCRDDEEEVEEETLLPSWCVESKVFGTVVVNPHACMEKSGKMLYLLWISESFPGVFYCLLYS